MAEMTWRDYESAMPGRFSSIPHYDRDSHTLTVFIKDDESYRERVDRLLTLYRSITTDEVVGCHIKHVKSIIQTVHAFNLGVESGDVTIGLLLLGIPLVDSGDEQIIRGAHYREIVEPIAARAGTERIPDLAGVPS